MADTVSEFTIAMAFQFDPKFLHAACAPGADVGEARNTYTFPYESRYCGEALTDGVGVVDGIRDGDTDEDGIFEGDSDADGVMDTVCVGETDVVADCDAVWEADCDAV